MTITALPAAPQPSDSQEAFNTRAFSLVASLDQFVTEANALASQANTDSGTATTQAGIASASADLAVASANEAEASAASAAVSAASAAASYDYFHDRYLGSKTADPAVDNDGNALVGGALYWNSATGHLRVWDGSLWGNAAVSGAVSEADLASSDPAKGAAMVGYKGGTQSEKNAGTLDSLAEGVSLIDAQQSANHVVLGDDVYDLSPTAQVIDYFNTWRLTDGRYAVRRMKDSDALPQAKKLWQLIRQNTRDIYLLVTGDSTGNGDDEWVRLYASHLASEVGGLNVTYKSWDDLTNTYSTVPLSTGNTNTIYIYNASVSGAKISHFLGAKREPVFDGKSFDMHIFNYGHNHGTGATLAQQIQNFAPVWDFIAENPNTSYIATAQNINTNAPGFSAISSEAVHHIAKQAGIGIIDAYSVFRRLEDNGDIAGYMNTDGVHPNSDGSRCWFYAVRNALYDGGYGVSCPANNALANSNTNIVKNALFTAWTGVAPDNWVVSGATVIADTTVLETMYASAKVTATTASGYISQDLSGYVKSLVGGIVVVARVLPAEGTSGNCGRWLCIADGITYKGSTWDTGKGGWQWAFCYIPKGEYANLTVKMLVGTTGDVINIDRVGVFSGDTPSDIGYDGLWPVLANYYDSAKVGIPYSFTGTLTTTSSSMTLTGAGPTAARMYCNMGWLEPGEQYTATWVNTGGKVGTVFVQDATTYNTAGSPTSNTIATATLASGTVTFTAVGTTGSLRFYGNSGTTALEITSLSVVKV